MPERFVRRKIEDEEIWLDFQEGQFYGVNPTATAILELWRAGVREPGAITARLVEAFEVSPGDARAAVDAYLTEVRPLGLLDDPS